jgi:hypothetical protein
MPLDIRFGRRSAKLANVLAYEAEVLALALGGLVRPSVPDRGHYPSLCPLDQKNGAISEMNAQVPLVSS